MYPRPSLSKAELKSFDGKKPLLKVKFKFNPTDIAVKRGCGFSSDPSSDTSVNDYGGLKFSGAKSDTLTLSFVLDSTEPELTDTKNALIMMSPIILSTPMLATAADAGMIPSLMGAVNDESVTEVLEVITEMTKLSEDDRKSKKANKDAVIYPRLLQFTWGDHIKFSGALEDFSFKLTLFDSDGVPKRAEVDIAMVGVFGEYLGDPEALLFAEGKSKATSKKSI
jgi:hypothetical protein